MIETAWWLRGFAGPAVLSGVLMLLLVRPWQRNAAGQRVAGAWNAALTLGMLLGLAWWEGYLGRNTFDLRLAHHWLLVAVPVAAAASLLFHHGGRAVRIASGLVSVGLAVGLTWRTVRPRIQYEWAVGEAAMQVGIAAGLWLAMLTAVLACERRRPGHTVPGVLAAWLGAAGTTIAMSGSLSIAQFGWSLAGVAAAAWGVAVWLPREIASRGCVHVLLAGGAVLLLNGYHYAELSLSHAVALAAAPSLLWLGMLAGNRPRPAGVLRTAAVLVVLAVIVGSAAVQFMEDANARSGRDSPEVHDGGYDNIPDWQAP